MKINIQTSLIRFGHVVASIALLLAIHSVNSTCMFMTYQPDIPQRLKQL